MNAPCYEASHHISRKMRTCDLYGGEDALRRASMLTREEVIWAYRALLGRPPESEAAITHHRNQPDFECLRQALIRSTEGLAHLREQCRESIAIPDYDRSVTVLIHLPKTGGTSLFNWLAESYSAKGGVSLQVNDLHGYTLEHLSKYDLIGGHFNYQTALALPRHRKTLITCFRNPVDRLLSLYRYYRSHPERKSLNPQVRAAQMMSAEEFFNCDNILLSTATNNCYLHTFSDSKDHAASANQKRELLKKVKDRLESVDEIVLTDSMDGSIGRLAGTLNFTSFGSLPRDNVTGIIHAQHPSIQKAEAIRPSALLMQALEPLTDFDCEVYEFARKLATNNSHASDENGLS